MKKVFVLLFLSFLLFSVVGCGSGDESNDKTPTETTPVSEKEDNQPITPDIENGDEVDSQEPSVSETTIEEQVIFESNGLVITATSIDTEAWMGPELALLIENNTDKSVTVQARNVSINGLMVDQIFSSDVVSGKKANDTITFILDDLAKETISSIKELEFVLHVFDTETWDDIVDSEPITIVTNHTEYVQTFDDSGIIAFEQNGIKIVAKKLNSSSSFWGADLYLYIENNSGQDITVQTRDVSVNGFMVDPIFSSEVINSKKAYDSISFFESDLTDNGITDIEEIELYFHVFELNSWETIIDSEVINIQF